MMKKNSSRRCSVPFRSGSFGTATGAGSGFDAKASGFVVGGSSLRTSGFVFSGSAFGLRTSGTGLVAVGPGLVFGASSGA